MNRISGNYNKLPDAQSAAAVAETGADSVICLASFNIDQERQAIELLQCFLLPFFVYAIYAI